ncbi:hypothetical protein HYPSUDRAFT_203961 [Hypholoma sublateritium FD-334 SS-4]|uniref:ZZ-type domain-containing protein n=1 Tax=Hypholoma sublateritium (strain FD-334 SS-4) TaxID=945553 RepID=A0A0D2PJY2_HYPSF|nr:hypothetical protein HYPSUDRAFT_203961 [Hypholoma sublateritium FD-334 SS-4]
MAPLQFNCDSCKLSIASTNPRVHCLVCADYDLCANCALGERFTTGHVAEHGTQVFKQSGGNGQQAIPASTVPTQPALNTPRGHPGNPGKPSSVPPPLPSRPSNTQRTPNSAGRGSAGWQPWFHPDSSPTDAYITLMNDIFTYLDPTNVGNLVPETFSGFLDDLGYLTHENAWKAGLQSTFALSKESMADKALKNAYDLFSIDHVLLQRQQAPHVDTTGLTASIQSVLGAAYKPSMLGSGVATTPGPMPAITRSGFIEISRIEALSDPSREWGNFSRMLKKYNLPRYRGWGDLPRSVLPAVPDASMLARVAGVTAFAQQKGQQLLDAARVDAQLRAQGRQAALDLISDRRVEYRYY